MAKTKISEYDSTAANNTDIDGVNLAEGCPPSGINNAIRESMAHLKDFQTGASGDSLTVGGTLTANGNANFTGEIQLNGSAGTSGQFLTSQGSGSDPTWTTSTAFVSGMIMMWSGTVATIPSGWLLCNGTSGTPDLRNKFIIGANADDGGAAKTNVTGSYTQTGGSKDAVVASHSHTATSSVTDPGHFHNLTNTGGGGSSGGGNLSIDSSIAGTLTTASKTTGISVSTTVNSAGVSATNANLPPYYALAFIMKS